MKRYDYLQLLQLAADSIVTSGITARAWAPKDYTGRGRKNKREEILKDHMVMGARIYFTVRNGLGQDDTKLGYYDFRLRMMNLDDEFYECEINHQEWIARLTDLEAIIREVLPHSGPDHLTSFVFPDGDDTLPGQSDPRSIMARKIRGAVLDSRHCPVTFMANGMPDVVGAATFDHMEDGTIQATITFNKDALKWSELERPMVSIGSRKT